MIHEPEDLQAVISAGEKTPIEPGVLIVPFIQYEILTYKTMNIE